MDYIKIAANVLRKEAEGILGQIDLLDDSFVKAVDLILAARGRVICTGMGKSGHIARKIAATLASTGTPAFFLHPAEGVHGDLGMVTANDVVIAFSNSGETAEIVNLLPSLMRIGAKIISIVGNAESSLGKMAQVTLVLGNKQEACPLGLAPTTSTTVSLALGDALALVLLEKKRFKPEDFAVFHPGGSLGQKLLLKVENVMHAAENNPIISDTANVREALFVMTEKGLGATAVVDSDHKLIGLVTDGDIRRGLESGNDFLNWNVLDMMTKSPRTIALGKLAAEALHLMENNQPRPITVLPVVDEAGRSVGMLHITDLLKRGIV